jgi:hypothetical protein
MVTGRIGITYLRRSAVMPVYWIVPVVGLTSRRKRWPMIGLVAPKTELSLTSATVPCQRLMLGSLCDCRSSMICCPLMA